MVEGVLDVKLIPYSKEAVDTFVDYWLLTSKRLVSAYYKTVRVALGEILVVPIGWTS